VKLGSGLHKHSLTWPLPLCSFKGNDQCGCCDCRRAFPCDEDVPCMFSPICFCTLCVNGSVKCNCGRTLAELKGERNPPLVARAPGGSVTAQPM
jgi:hypothetical protein